MYVDKVVLKNIRGFDELEFSFDRGDGRYAGWTVITGDNGSGKSTLLKSIAMALTGRDVTRTLQTSFKRWIKSGGGTASIELTIVREESSDGVFEQMLEKNPNLSAFSSLPLRRGAFDQPFSAKIGLVTVGKEIVLDSAPFDIDTLPALSTWSPSRSGWFSCGYGPFRRISGAASDVTRLMTSPFTERFATMFEEGASLSEVTSWLKDLHHKSLEGKPVETQQYEFLLELLRDDLLPNQIYVERVDSDGLWLRDRQGAELAWLEMSDGYRSALALLIDILRHLMKCYEVDELFGRDAEGRLIVNRSGVVLIDEVDAHLHPEWQRTIGFWLKSRFPNVQFLVTTHSPIICQAADENGLFVLPEPGSGERPRPLTREEYERVITSKPDGILRTPAFGLQNTRSPLAVENRAEFSDLQAKLQAGAQLSDTEQKRIEELRPFAETDE